MTPEVHESIHTRLGKLDSFPAIPAILRPLLHYLEQPVEEVQVGRIVDLVSCDQALTAQCLRLANAPPCGRAQRVDSMRGAALALGVQRLRELFLSCRLVRLPSGAQSEMNPVAFWEHSFGCALVSRHFARKIHYPEPEKAYLAGLLHDLGELVNAISLPDEFQAAWQRARREHIPLYEAERDVIGFTHCDTGGILAECWNLPEGLGDVMLYHHDVQQAKTNVTLVALVSLSDLLCAIGGLGYGLPQDRYRELLESPAWNILTHDYPYISERELGHFAFEMESFLSDVRIMVASVLGTEPQANGFTP